MMQEQSRCLNEALNQQNILAWSIPRFEHVPQILPRFMGVPKRSSVKTMASLGEEFQFSAGQGTRRLLCHVRGDAAMLETVRVRCYFSALFKRGFGGCHG